MKTRRKIEEDASESDGETFKLPETVICVDTICHICSAEFLDEEDLKLHIEQMHLTERSLSRYCQFCSSIFASIEEYASHLCDVHILNIRCCKYCMRAFSHGSDVKKHEKKHLGPESAFACSNCTSYFNNVNDLEQHEYLRHKDSKDGVLLQECYSLLSSFLNIRAPTFLQSLGTSYTYICMSCKLKTSDVEYYMQHLQQKNCRSLVCDRCCNVYNKTIGLQRHFTSHLECFNKLHDDLKEMCSRCTKLFDYDQLQHHIKVCQAVKCSSCDLIFDTISERADHQAKTHKPRFTIKVCRYCHREFVGQVSLEKHINRSHKKDLHLYKYFCIYCNDVFNHPKKLFSHFFSKHKDLKPFTCKTCDKTFKLRKQFTLHIKLDHKGAGTVKFDDNFHVYFTVAPSAAGDCEKNAADKETTAQANCLISNAAEKNGNDNMQEIQAENEFPALETDVDLVMCPTATDLEPSDIEKTTRKNLARRKRKSKIREYVDLTLENDSEEMSEDEPLIQVKRRTKTRQIEKLSFPNWHQKSKEMMKNRRKFTCKICKKYCYTYQNFNHHMSLHQTHEKKKCIKCSKVFKSKEKLNKHIMKEHSSSKLTETLKNVLERRKTSLNQPTNAGQSQTDRKSITERFLKTIKKVNTERTECAAKVTRVVDKLSVKKFIENFTPESNEANSRKGDMTAVTINRVSIKLVVPPTDSTPTIKLTRFKPETPIGVIRLKQPERFRDSPGEQCDVSIRLVQDPIAQRKMNFDQPIEQVTPLDYEYEDAPESYDESDTVDNIIPEVAHEVMLEGTDEVQKSMFVTHKFVIPNLPEVYKDVHIAHLLPEAPYFKIVKIDEVLKEPEARKEEGDSSQSIKLPDGTTLVNVNPLAHLLAGKHLEQPARSNNKPKIDFEKAVAKALLKSSETPQVRRKSKVKADQKAIPTHLSINKTII